MNNKPLARLILAVAVLSSLVASAVVVADRAPKRTATVAAAGIPHGDRDDMTVQSAAIAFAGQIRGLPVRDGDFDDPARYCRPDRMHVQWSPPAAGFTYGAHIEPLGPVPDRDTTAVNGIIVCEGSTYAYMGFEALRAGNGWQIIPIPDVQDGETPDEVEKHGDTIDPGLVAKATPPAGANAPGRIPSPAAAKLTAAIEAYAGYDAQDTCSGTAKPGVLAFRKLVLGTNPNTRSMGITRACSSGGRSEHKEGRAWDWGARMDRPGERASAQALIDWLFATDAFGNKHAMARRLGIMYIVWNRKIWGAYRADQGWRSYSGSNPHTDHVHFSFAWPGADGKTSFWTGVPAAMPGSSSGGGGGGGSWRQAGGTERPVRDGRRFKGDGNTEWWKNRPDTEWWKDRDRWNPEDWDRERWRRDPSATPVPKPSGTPSDGHTDEPADDPTPHQSPQPSPGATPAATTTPSPAPAAASGDGSSTNTSWRRGDGTSETKQRRKKRTRKKRTRKKRTREPRTQRTEYRSWTRSS